MKPGREFGIPIFDATASTPKYSVSCTENWGTCPFAGKQTPIPSDAVTDGGSDGVMSVVDWSTRTSFEFWQARKSGGSWLTSWGAVMSLDSDARATSATGSAIGARISRLAGVVRISELKAGRIPHALVFSTSNACLSSNYRYPANGSDGGSGAADCVPEGTRIQLDPTVNVDAISGITAGEKAVAKALQTYGA